MRNNNYDDRDTEYGEDMLSVFTECSKFAGRRDVNSFNMTNYRSCENCAHMGADYRCSLGMDARHSGL